MKKSELLDFFDDTKANKYLLRVSANSTCSIICQKKIFKNTKSYLDHIVTSHFYEVKLIA